MEKGSLGDYFADFGVWGLEGKTRPVAVAPSEKGEELRFKQISVSYNSPGRNHTCAVTFEGKFYCWDSNITGGLGFGEDFEGESVTVDIYNYKKYKREKRVVVSKIQLVPREVKVGK